MLTLTVLRRIIVDNNINEHQIKFPYSLGFSTATWPLTKCFIGGQQSRKSVRLRHTAR